MACLTCVDNLARKLIARHKKLDLLRAYELAYKAVERVEKRQGKTPKEKTMIRNLPKGHPNRPEGNEWDFSVDCDSTGGCVCLGGQPCMFDFQCFGASTCACSCTDSTCLFAEANSHAVSDDCAANETGCTCNFITGFCDPVFCSCLCYYNCYCACDDPYVWDGSDCVLPVVPAKPLINKPLVNPTLVNPPMVRA